MARRGSSERDGEAKKKSVTDRSMERDRDVLDFIKWLCDDFSSQSSNLDLGDLSVDLHDQGDPYGDVTEGDMSDLAFVQCEIARSPQGVSRGSPQGQVEGSHMGHSDAPDLPVNCEVDELLGGPLSPGNIELTLQDLEQLQNHSSAIGPLQNAPEGCHTDHLPVPQMNAKTGSRAFNYIPNNALLETHGVPAPSRQAFLTPGYDGTPPLKDLSGELKLVTGEVTGDVLCGNVGVKVPHTAYSVPVPLDTVPVESKIVPNETSASFPIGTVSVLPKIVPGIASDSSTICSSQLADLKVPDRARSASVPCGNHVDTKLMVPDSVSSAPILCGTPTVDTRVTVPDKANNTSVPCVTQTSDTKLAQDTASTCHSAAYGTVTINTSLIPASESASDIGLHSTRTIDTTNIAQHNGTKKRVRKRKNTSETVKKTRKYEQGPLSDQLEERKRLDAIRAKKCRERNRGEILALREKLAQMEKEKNAMVQELAGRQAYEEVIRKILWEKTGIIVLPFTPSSDKKVPPQPQTSG